jgi:hypothetical protein
MYNPQRKLRSYIYRLYDQFNIPIPTGQGGKFITNEELWGNFIVVMSAGGGGGGVVSVNGKTGPVVTLTAGDVGAYTKNETYTKSEVNNAISTAIDSLPRITGIKVDGNIISPSSDGVVNINLSGKVDKVGTFSRIYGTDASGNQTTYGKNDFGAVTDVQVNNVSVLDGTVAKIPQIPDVSTKLDINVTPDKIYGTDASGNQVMYDVPGGGTVTDVQVNGTTVVDQSTKVANIDLSPISNEIDEINTALDEKADIADISDAEIEIQLNSVRVGSFTLNQSGDQNINIALETGTTYWRTSEKPNNINVGDSVNLEIQNLSKIVGEHANVEKQDFIAGVNDEDKAFEAIVTNVSTPNVSVQILSINQITSTTWGQIDGEVNENAKLMAKFNEYYTKTEIDNNEDIQNVNPDWTETDSTKKSFIENKPNLPNSFVTDVTYDGNSILSNGVAELDDLLDAKVDKVAGKGLSTEDYTTEEQTKLASIEDEAQKNVQSDWNVTDTTSDAFIKNKPPIPEIPVSGVEVNDVSVVDNATKTAKITISSAGISGNYNDLTNKPDIGAITTALDEVVDKLADIEPEAQKNVQSDWNVTDNTSDAFIKNKPAAPGDGEITVKVNGGSPIATFTLNQTNPVIVDIPVSTNVTRWRNKETMAATVVGTAYNIDINDFDKLAGNNNTPDLQDIVYGVNGDGNPYESIVTGLPQVDEVTITIINVNANVNATWESITGSIESNSDLMAKFNGKVDKVAGKELSTNDFDNTYKDKVDNIEANAQVNVKSDWNATSGDAEILNKPAIPDVSNKLDMSSDASIVYGTDEDGEQVLIPVNSLGGGLVDDVVVDGTSAMVGKVAVITLPDISGKLNISDEHDKIYGTDEDGEQILIPRAELENVQPDWNAVSGDAAILNKPDLDIYVIAEAGKGLSSNDFTTDLQTKLNSIAPGAEVNVQSDWGETDSGSDAFIIGKPTSLTDIDPSYTEPGDGHIVLQLNGSKVGEFNLNQNSDDVININVANNITYWSTLTKPVNAAVGDEFNTTNFTKIVGNHTEPETQDIVYGVDSTDTPFESIIKAISGTAITAQIISVSQVLSVVWGGISGNIQNQGDLFVTFYTKDEIDTNADIQNVNADWNATTGYSKINNKPTALTDIDPSYIPFTSANAAKLNNIEDGAQINVKPNWNAAAGTPSEIINKPTALTDIDAAYIPYTNAEKTKLRDIEEGAQVNVKPDWNATTGPKQIVNKPETLSDIDSAYIPYSNAEKTKLATIAANAQVNVQSNWNETDTASDAFIIGKPIIPDVSNKLNINTTPDKIYGTDASGNQVMYDVPGGGTGEVNDVRVDNTSVVINGIARINLTGKVDKTIEATKLYGTDEYGDPKLYEVSSIVSGVSDVVVNGDSVVHNSIANIENVVKFTGARNKVFGTDGVGDFIEYNYSMLANLVDDVKLNGTSIVDEYRTANIVIDTSDKVDRSEDSDIIYGTDENGDPKLYQLSELGTVTDVKLNGTSVVNATGVAEIAAVERTNDFSKIYGTDELGSQTTYDLANLENQVTDVTVNGTSVVNANGVAEISTDVDISMKVDKVIAADRIYGTGENEEQTSYPLNSLYNLVDDVQVNGESVVDEDTKIASIDLTPKVDKDTYTDGWAVEHLSMREVSRNIIVTKDSVNVNTNEAETSELTIKSGNQSVQLIYDALKKELDIRAKQSYDVEINVTVDYPDDDLDVYLDGQLEGFELVINAEVEPDNLEYVLSGSLRNKTVFAGIMNQFDGQLDNIELQMDGQLELNDYLYDGVLAGYSIFSAVMMIPEGRYILGQKLTFNLVPNYSQWETWQYCGPSIKRDDYQNINYWRKLYTAF